MAWRERRGLDPPTAGLGERFMLLHAFSHALIRELALECGLHASSIRERIYAMRAAAQASRWPGPPLHAAPTARERSAAWFASASRRARPLLARL
jgi:hypothetical protein